MWVLDFPKTYKNNKETTKYYWVQIEGQQSERNKVQQEKAALAKLDRIKQDQGKRADDLEREAADAESKVCVC